MNQLLKRFDNVYFIIGHKLLGLYFFVPGVMKIVDYQNTLTLMVSKGVPLANALLPVTILLQVGLGLSIIVGKNLRISALILFGLTILINVFIHNFWSLSGDPSQAHEMQNFIKNLAIAAGLLVLASKGKD
ncbi:DoxX family protein [Arenicella xantha]|uniref:Putative oxidoreductase n=1 Tax=Arenicella xantha TaxID=644221 RepID=A0A395JRH8_9GAMM|nr:DoxX family protein [Arenicella xantha]RBP51300.1 putative oxidoreductase [Arenicella xantha]